MGIEPLLKGLTFPELPTKNGEKPENNFLGWKKIPPRNAKKEILGQNLRRNGKILEIKKNYGASIKMVGKKPGIEKAPRKLSGKLISQMDPKR